jgi:hypothetical protein
MAQSQRRPWPIILTFAGIVLLVAAWCIYWVIASGIVRDNFEGQLARLTREDIKLECKTTKWSGFPFRFERDCLGPVLTVKGDGAEAGRLLFVMQAYMPNRAIALIDGPIHGSGFIIKHERAIASARFSGKTSWQATLEVPKLSATPYGSADRLLVSARDTGGDRLDIALDATAADLLIESGSLLKLDEASLEASVPRASIGRDLLKALGRSGEKIGIETLRLKKGELIVSAKGEIGLDASGHVNGRLTTTTNRLDLLMAELKQNFGLTNKDTETLATMIGLLQPGKTTDVTLDLIAKDGKLYWGPVKLAELPPVL